MNKKTGDLYVDLPENRATSVHFLQWQKGLSSKCDAKGNAREITSLFPVTLDLDSAVKKLKSFFPQIKIHVFVASGVTYGSDNCIMISSP